MPREGVEASPGIEVMGGDQRQDFPGTQPKQQRVPRAQDELFLRGGISLVEVFQHSGVKPDGIQNGVRASDDGAA